MRSPEVAPDQFEPASIPPLDMDLSMEGFDINAAFQEAFAGVASDTELELDEKVRRMEAILEEGTSDLYRNFIDLSAMAVQIQMLCNHDHALSQSVQNSSIFSSFMRNHTDGEHTHAHDHPNKHDHEHDAAEKTDPKSRKKKKKKRYSWLLGIIGNER